MGTWGSGPFDSDTAEDYLNELDENSGAGRLEVVKRTLRAAIEAGGGSSSSVLPEEVIAAVVAANIPAGNSLAWNGGYPGITEWLDRLIARDTADLAVRAMEVALPAEGWFWRSWVDAEERAEAQAAMDTLRSVLNSVEGGSSEE